MQVVISTTRKITISYKEHCQFRKVHPIWDYTTKWNSCILRCGITLHQCPYRTSSFCHQGEIGGRYYITRSNHPHYWWHSWITNSVFKCYLCYIPRKILPTDPRNRYVFSSIGCYCWSSNGVRGTNSFEYLPFPTTFLEKICRWYNYYYGQTSNKWFPSTFEQHQLINSLYCWNRKKMMLSLSWMFLLWKKKRAP